MFFHDKKALIFYTLFGSPDNICTFFLQSLICHKIKRIIFKTKLFFNSGRTIPTYRSKQKCLQDILKHVVLCLQSRFMKYSLGNLTNTFINADVETLQDELTKLLRASVSDFDYYEHFYHAWFLGLLAACSGSVGDPGCSDLVCRFQDLAMIVGLKRESRNSAAALEDVADRALRQVIERKQDAPHVHASRVGAWDTGAVSAGSLPRKAIADQAGS